MQNNENNPLKELDKEAPTEEDLAHEHLKWKEPDVEVVAKDPLLNSLQMVMEKSSDELWLRQDFLHIMDVV